MKKFSIKTVRRSGLTDLEKGVAILKIAEDDPLGRYGCRSVKEKLALQGTHVERSVFLYFPDIV
jgi:hypothetical protein